MKCVDGEGKPEIDGVSHYHCHLCPAICKRHDVFRNHLRNHNETTPTAKEHNETTPTVEEEHQNHSEEMPASPSPDAHASLDRQNEFMDNHDLSDDVENPDTHSEGNANTNSHRCVKCSRDFASKKSLQNHTRYYHISPDYINSTRYLGGICVDPDRGIYMIRRSFSGTSHPLHVLHNFGVNGGFSCELNDCRELSNTTKRSGNPNFICNHLKSVQYVNKNSNSSYILPRESLKALINKVTWFKRSREEECLKLQDNALQEKAPLIAEYSDSTKPSSIRYRHFSVYDGNIHHYSRFKRVTVTYDSNKNKWGCSCCRAKVNCVHKCVAKWFMYVERPENLLLNDNHPEQSQSDSDDEIDGLFEGFESATGTSQSTSGLALSYPPKRETVLAKMVLYLHTVKRIPVDIPRAITHDLDTYPTCLVPTEEQCAYCEDVDLSCPIQITRKGRIFTTTKVIEG